MQKYTVKAVSEKQIILRDNVWALTAESAAEQIVPCFYDTDTVDKIYIAVFDGSVSNVSLLDPDSGQISDYMFDISDGILYPFHC